MEKKYNPDAQLLKLVIAGSVDDGKSTFLGRLFYDLGAIYEDQLASLKKISTRQGKKEIDLSLFTDGLSAEREQKITIDVAYRYLSTPKRRLIIADVPGHEQYTRNMVTGASNANLAIILTDARKGILPQSRRHLFIVSLMGVSHILVVINKMDLVDYNQDVFEKIKTDFIDFAAKLDIHDLQFIPVSSLKGDLVVKRGNNMNWYQGPTAISYLENLETSSDRNLLDFRFPIQLVIRPNQDFRGYAGRVEGGTVKVGEKVKILPSGEETKIKSIIIGKENKENYTFNGQMAVLILDDEIDISRGDMITRINNLAEVNDNFEATICWMSNQVLSEGKSYFLKQTTKTNRCFVNKIFYRININNLHRENTRSLALNEIGRVHFTTTEPLIFDPYNKNKNTGGFVVIDELTNNTVGAGTILRSTKKLNFAKSQTPEIKKNQGFVLWFTGLSQSGKTSTADKIYEILKEKRIKVERLDADIVRQHLNKDLGFTKADRNENIRRIGFISKLLSRNGVGVIASFISPYRTQRVRLKKETQNFIEVFCNCPLEICEQRDTKGLYQKARNREIENFTGISDPYEKPETPDIELKTDIETIKESAQKIVDYLVKNKYIPKE